MLLIAVCSCVLVSVGYLVCLWRHRHDRLLLEGARTDLLIAECCYTALQKHTNELRVRLGVREGAKTVADMNEMATRGDGLPDA